MRKKHYDHTHARCQRKEVRVSEVLAPWSWASWPWTDANDLLMAGNSSNGRSSPFVWKSLLHKNTSFALCTHCKPACFILQVVRLMGSLVEFNAQNQALVRWERKFCQEHAGSLRLASLRHPKMLIPLELRYILAVGGYTYISRKVQIEVYTVAVL